MIHNCLVCGKPFDCDNSACTIEHPCISNFCGSTHVHVWLKTHPVNEILETITTGKEAPNQ